MKARIAMAQVNSIVGDLEGNIEKCKKNINNAEKNGADLIVFPELAVTGYPPQDLLYEKAFVKKNKELLFELIVHNADIAGVVGFVDYDQKNL